MTRVEWARKEIRRWSQTFNGDPEPILFCKPLYSYQPFLWVKWRTTVAFSTEEWHNLPYILKVFLCCSNESQWLRTEMKVREQFGSYHSNVSLIEFLDKSDVCMKEKRNQEWFHSFFAPSNWKDAVSIHWGVYTITVPFNFGLCRRLLDHRER